MQESPTRREGGQQAASPRDVFMTVYGRKPVLEALIDPALTVDKAIVAANARGATVQEILDAAAHRHAGAAGIGAPGEGTRWQWSA